MSKAQTAIRDYLKKHGITKAHLSRKCGWSDQKTGRIVSNRQEITITDLEKICDALGVSYDFFLQES